MVYSNQPINQIPSHHRLQHAMKAAGIGMAMHGAEIGIGYGLSKFTIPNPKFAALERSRSFLADALTESYRGSRKYYHFGKSLVMHTVMGGILGGMA